MAARMTEDKDAFTLKDLNKDELGKFLNPCPPEFGVMALARNCSLNHAEIKDIRRSHAGGGSPSYAFLQRFRSEQPDTTIEKLKKCFKEKKLTLALKELNKFPDVNTFEDLSKKQISDLSVKLDKDPKVPGMKSWKDMAWYFNMQDEINIIETAISAADKYCPTSVLIDTLIVKGFTIDQFLEEVHSVGNVEVEEWIRKCIKEKAERQNRECTKNDEDSIADTITVPATSMELVESENTDPIRKDQDHVFSKDEIDAPRKRKGVYSTDVMSTNHVEESSVNGVKQIRLTGNNTCLLVVNNFLNTKKEPLRGYDIDKQTLERTFKWLNFCVENGDNLSADEMEEYFKKWSQKDFKDATCLVCIILSHGEKEDGEGVIIGNDGESISISKITRMFSECKSLSGKPKLYFIQACRGRLPCSVIPNANESSSTLRAAGGDNKENPYIAEDVDSYVFYSTTPDKAAYVDDKTGSWFIQALCEVLGTRSYNTHLSDMEKLVSEKVKQKVVGDKVEACQVVTTITSNIYFCPRTPTSTGICE